jgi:hypothetical protein
MHIARSLFRSILVLGTLSLSIPAYAATFNFSGAFTQDDNLLEFQFTIAGNASVVLQSFSYGGNGTTISAGGFAPVLSLFGPIPSGDPPLLGFNAGGASPNCSPRLTDPVTHLCLDAVVAPGVLTAGTYLVTLTENDNEPQGTDFNSGFSEAGQGNFTGPDFGPGSGSFYDPFGNHRTANYAFSISGVTSASPVSATPEPAGLVSLLSGLSLLAGAGLKRKKTI